MEHQHDELTDTGVIRFQTAQDMATARFVTHFTRDLSAQDSQALMRMVRETLDSKVAA